MPQKLGKGGSGLQNYVPKGNEAGGQYGDNETGSNKHYFAHFEKQPKMQMVSDTELESKTKTLEDEISKIGNDLSSQEKKNKKIKKIQNTIDNFKWMPLEKGTSLEQLSSWANEAKMQVALSSELSDLEMDNYFSQIQKIYEDKLLELADKVGENDLILDDDDLLEDNYDKEIKTVDKPVEALNKKNAKIISQKNDTDCYDYLLGFEGEFDENKLKNLSSEDLHNLVLAKQNLESAKNKDFFKSINSNLHKELKDYELGSGNLESIKIWGKAPSNYDALVQSIPQKEKYYDGIIEKYNEIDDPSQYQTLNYKNALKGKEALEKIKNDILPEYEKKISEATAKKEEYESIINESKALVEKYSNPNNVYSQASKEKALWFKSYNEASKHLAPIAKETYKTIDPDDLDKIKYYTQSYSFINEPLRNKMYSGSYEKKNMFIDYVKGMTKAIDKSVLKENMWVQRGVSTLNINGKDISSYNAEDLHNVVFEDQGFLSCGAAKGTGFTNNSVIMNIYCPKGTKALYVDPISHYQGHENEMIIQRGYSFKITKVEKKGYMTYMDCEVILNSDIKKYDDEKLKQLQEKNFY